MNSARKSPLKDRPLRSPGQSLEERIHDLLLDRVILPFLIAAMLAMVALQEWISYYTLRDPMPWTFTILTGLAAAFFLYRRFTISKQLRQLKLGRDGEREVGQLLENLRKEGFQILHDIVGNGFNVDHVLIGPEGIFTVETKTRMKPDKGPAEIAFDGETVTVGGQSPDRNPVIQARAQAGWLRGLLRESTGRDFQVMPVIVFPGWFVKSSGKPQRPIWVLNPKGLPKFIKHEKPILTEDEVQLASFHLSRFIRSEEARR